MVYSTAQTFHDPMAVITHANQLLTLSSSVHCNQLCSRSQLWIEGKPQQPCHMHGIETAFSDCHKG